MQQRAAIPSTRSSIRLKSGNYLLVVALLAPAIARASDGGTPIDLATASGLQSNQLAPSPDSSSRTSKEPPSFQRGSLTPRIEWEPWNPDGAVTPLVTGSIEASLANETLGRWNVGGCGASTCASNRPGFHPGTRVIVETHPISPHSKQRDVGLLPKLQADFRNRGYWLYRNCFEATARNSQSSGGDIWLRVQVSRGAVTQSQILSATIRQRSIAYCVKVSTRTIRLSSLLKHAFAFNLRVRLFPGDVPLLPTRRPVTRVEQLNPTRFGATIDPIRRAVEECALQGLQRDPALWGRIALQVQVRLDGHVGDVREDDSHFPDRAVLECCRRSILDRTLGGPPVLGEVRLAIRLGELGVPSHDHSVAPLAPPSPLSGH
jgi:hypothetical protein